MNLFDDAPPRCRFAAPPQGGGADGPAEPVPSRLLGFAFAAGC